MGIGDIFFINLSSMRASNYDGGNKVALIRCKIDPNPRVLRLRGMKIVMIKIDRVDQVSNDTDFSLYINL